MGGQRSNMGIRILDQFTHGLGTKNVPCLVSFLPFVPISFAHLMIFTDAQPEDIYGGISPQVSELCPSAPN